MSALNGYAERSQDMLSQVLSKTAPKAQMFKDRTIRPLTMTTRKNLVDDNMLIKHHNDQQQRAAAKSAAGDIAAASQQKYG
jgi:cell division septation protein DedD